MDKTIELVVVAMVILVAATILLFPVQDRTDGFGTFLDNQQSSAKCDLWKTQYKNSNCENSDLKTQIEQNSCGTVPSC